MVAWISVLATSCGFLDDDPAGGPAAFDESVTRSGGASSSGVPGSRPPSVGIDDGRGGPGTAAGGSRSDPADGRSSSADPVAGDGGPEVPDPDGSTGSDPGGAGQPLQSAPPATGRPSPGPDPDAPVAVAAKEWGVVLEPGPRAAGPGCGPIGVVADSVLDLATAPADAPAGLYLSRLDQLTGALDRAAGSVPLPLLTAYLIQFRDEVRAVGVSFDSSPVDIVRERGDVVLGSPGGPLERLLAVAAEQCPTVISGRPDVAYFWLD